VNQLRDLDDRVLLSTNSFACSSRDLATDWAALALDQPLGHLFTERPTCVPHPGILRPADVGLIVSAEDALFVGFVIPGETAAILGGVAANRGHVALATVIGVVIVAAVAGDSVGYQVGKHVGPRILTWQILERHRPCLRDAQEFLARRGGTAVLLGRWVAFSAPSCPPWPAPRACRT
jgi:membrane protein DedA with SNARE-associated domain